MAAGAQALIVNDYELEMFRQKTGLKEQELLELTPRLIVTRGEEGSVPLHRRRPANGARGSPQPGPGPHRGRGRLPGRASQRAGSGALLGGSTCLGAVLASFCVEQQGTQEHRLEISQFWERTGRTSGRRRRRLRGDLLGYAVGLGEEEGRFGR